MVALKVIGDPECRVDPAVEGAVQPRNEPVDGPHVEATAVDRMQLGQRTLIRCRRAVTGGIGAGQFELRLRLEHAEAAIDDRADDVQWLRI